VKKRREQSVQFKAGGRKRKAKRDRNRGWSTKVGGFMVYRYAVNWRSIKMAVASMQPPIENECVRVPAPRTVGILHKCAWSWSPWRWYGKAKVTKII
jgi:hypothetical protein